MILKADFPFAGKFLQGSFEFVFGAVRVLPCRFPLVDIGLIDEHAIDFDTYHWPAAGKFQMIPLTDWIGRVGFCSLGVVKCTVEIFWILAALGT